VLGKVIDYRQSAFLEGRGLMDSVLVANEVLEEAKRTKKISVIFKADYEKAYISVKWDLNLLRYLFLLMGARLRNFFH